MDLEEQVPTGNVQSVLDWVAQDPAPPARRDAALEVERTKGTPRTSLVTQLEALNTPPDGRDAAQVADQADPLAVDTVPVQVDDSPRPLDPAAQANSDTTVRAPQDGDAVLCTIHFPQGWDSANIRRTEEVTGVKQPAVTCEHGTYRRQL